MSLIAMIGALVHPLGYLEPEYFILFWDGDLQKLVDKAGIGILINIAILVALLILGSVLQ